MIVKRRPGHPHPTRPRRKPRRQKAKSVKQSPRPTLKVTKHEHDPFEAQFVWIMDDPQEAVSDNDEPPPDDDDEYDAYLQLEDMAANDLFDEEDEVVARHSSGPSRSCPLGPRFTASDDPSWVLPVLEVATKQISPDRVVRYVMGRSTWLAYLMEADRRGVADLTKYEGVPVVRDALSLYFLAAVSEKGEVIGLLGNPKP